MEDKISVLIPQEELETRIREMAAQISKDYEGESLHLVCILRGSIFFTCEGLKVVITVLSSLHHLNTFRVLKPP